MINKNIENPLVTEILDSFIKSAAQFALSKNYESANIVVIAGKSVLRKFESEGLIKDCDTFDEYWYKFYNLNTAIKG
jgi:hypothetical protein